MVASFWGQVVVEGQQGEPGVALAGVVGVARTMVELGRQGVEEPAAHGKALTALTVAVGAGPLVPLVFHHMAGLRARPALARVVAAEAAAVALALAPSTVVMPMVQEGGRISLMRTVPVAGEGGAPPRTRARSPARMRPSTAAVAPPPPRARVAVVGCPRLTSPGHQESTEGGALRTGRQASRAMRASSTSPRARC